VKADNIHALFSTYGEVKSVKLMVDPVTRRSVLYGFIDIAFEGDARNAVADVKGKMFMKRLIWNLLNNSSANSSPP